MFVHQPPIHPGKLVILAVNIVIALLRPAHLVARSLRALVKAGCDQAWLAVNVDNPAHELYLRLGFEDHGMRARYTELKAPPQD